MRDDFTAHSIVVNIYLGILILSFMILSVTLVVRLKMESLSGLTDLVVSMTKTRGGLRTWPPALPPAWPCPPDWGQFWHLQPTHLHRRLSSSASR